MSPKASHDPDRLLNAIDGSLRQGRFFDDVDTDAVADAAMDAFRATTRARVATGELAFAFADAHPAPWYARQVSGYVLIFLLVGALGVATQWWARGTELAAAIGNAWPLFALTAAVVTGAGWLLERLPSKPVWADAGLVAAGLACVFTWGAVDMQSSLAESAARKDMLAAIGSGIAAGHTLDSSVLTFAPAPVTPKKTDLVWQAGMTNGNLDVFSGKNRAAFMALFADRVEPLGQTGYAFAALHQGARYNFRVSKEAAGYMPVEANRCVISAFDPSEKGDTKTALVVRPAPADNQAACEKLIQDWAVRAAAAGRPAVSPR